MNDIKLTFIFTTQPTLEETPREERTSTSIKLPIEATERDDFSDKVLGIAKAIAHFSHFSIFVHCPEAGLHYHPISQREPLPLRKSLEAAHLTFNNRRYPRLSAHLYFYAPIPHPFKHLGRRNSRNVIHSSMLVNISGNPHYSPEQQNYVRHMRAVIDPLLELLNVKEDHWMFKDFHPQQWQNRQVNRYNKLQAKQRKETAKAEHQKKRLEEKIATQTAKSQADGPSTHGAGRMPGARPGIYKSVQMRSQLEIKFAAELDESGIKWVYEGEALGEAQYLVDFYLPDLGIWVEVKGNITAKDRQVLPDVAKFLKTERKQRLLMYTGSGKCYVINPSGFREIERKQFWTEVLK